MTNTELFDKVVKLAKAVGVDIKSLRESLNNTSAPNTSTLATKEEVKELEKKIAKASGTPTINLSVEPNGDVYADIEYPNNPSPTPSPAPATRANATPASSQDTIPYGTTKTYLVNWGIAVAGSPGTGRGYLEWSPISGFGKLHLDIKMTQNSGNGNVIATLPANAPVPSVLLETAVDASNNSIYVEPNSRNIKGWGVTGNNKRYIFDIIGFWKELK